MNVRTLCSGIGATLTLLYPDVCQLCGQERATAVEGYVGPACRKGVQIVKPPYCSRCGLPFEGEIEESFECANCREMDLHFRFARSAVAAKGPVLEAIHRYKYQHALWFEQFLAGLLVREAQGELDRWDWDWIVPVPLHAAKQREREFNQALRLASHLSAATGIPAHNRLLKRVAPTRTQTQLTREERAENVRHAFRLRHQEDLEGARIVLLDDVLTTGATTSACARVLRDAGAADVCVWTVARGL